MAIQFSDTVNRTGIIQLIEDDTNTQSASTSSYSLTTKTRDINIAYSRYFVLAQQVEGRWQIDDTNQTDYPIITSNVVSGQQDYSFTVDGSTVPNQILDIYRVELVDSTGFAKVLRPIDQFDVRGVALTEFMKNGGVPEYYDKTSNGLVLYPTPNYSYTAGLKIYFNRTPVFFLSTDTTKKPGIPDMFHEYLAKRPSYQYALRKSLPNMANLKQETLELEDQIRTYYANRSKDEVKQMTAKYRTSE